MVVTRRHSSADRHFEAAEQTPPLTRVQQTSTQVSTCFGAKDTARQSRNPIERRRQKHAKELIEEEEDENEDEECAQRAKTLRDDSTYSLRRTGVALGFIALRIWVLSRRRPFGPGARFDVGVHASSHSVYRLLGP